MNLSDSKGDWALVTGASSGIGNEFCRQLAKAGVNIFMVARREKILEELSFELKTKYKIQTLILSIDLSETGSATKVWEKSNKENIKIRMLINNAGFGPWGSFEKTNADDYERIIQLNATTPIALCRLYLDDMLTFPSSAIINLSSPAALQPIPYIAVYAAAKACLHSFSLALYGEWKSLGITVQTLLPGPTATEFDNRAGAYPSNLGEIRRPPIDIVKASLENLNKDKPFITTSKGAYKQRLFAGIAPVKMIVAEVKKMFLPPLGR